jgi:hypothetical protein
MARDRIAGAGIHDPTLEAGLALVEAGGARLAGDAGAAVRILESIDPSLSPEFPVEITRERARLAWSGGDHDTALGLYQQAEAESLPLLYPALARLIREESAVGPRPVRSESHQEFVARTVEERVGVTRPYAVVVRYIVDRSVEHYFDMERRVEELLSTRPHLGYVDGDGTDGRVWDLYLEGEDPDDLWAEIRALVMPLAGPGSQVELRRGDGIETVTLA